MDITIYRREDFAGFWRRSLGNLIDAVFFGIIYVLLRSTLPTQWAEVTWLLIVWGYLIGFKTTINATPGFRLLKIKLVSIFPVDLTFWQIIVRSVTAVFSGLALGLGYFWAGFDRRKQTWHDKIAGTYVVSSAAEPVGTREVASVGLKRGAWCMAAFIAAFVIPLAAFTTFFYLIVGQSPLYLWQMGRGSEKLISSPTFDIKTFTQTNSDLPSDMVLSLAVQDGTLWVGTLRGLARFHQGQWQVFQREPGGLLDNMVECLAVAPDGALWVGTLGGLARFHQGNWQVFQQEPGKLPDNHVTSLAVQDGALWVGTLSGGLARFHQGNWQVFQQEPGKLPNDCLTSLAVQDGALWVGTHGGLARFHQGQWQVYQREPGGLPDNWVECLAVAPDGALWVGTRLGGLARFH